MSTTELLLQLPENVLSCFVKERADVLVFHKEPSNTFIYVYAAVSRPGEFIVATYEGNALSQHIIVKPEDISNKLYWYLFPIGNGRAA